MTSLSDRQVDAFDNPAKVLCREGNVRVLQPIKARMGQTRQSDNLALTAYVVVVEFGTPRAKVVQR